MMTQLFDEETMSKQYDIASRRESLEQGIKIGEERAKLSLASALITKGILSLTEVSQVTGLPVEKLKELTMTIS
ncbi:MAG: hypothetical protein J6A25_04250 [Lachnospiraceae bacterium]|nr:hypothetical protein [Lachnospiraceae bacterium]